MPIDHGLDGFSGHAFHGAHPPAPLVESAVFDQVTNATTVKGTFDAPDASGWRLTLYALQRVTDWGERPETMLAGNRFTFILPGQVFGGMRVLANPVDPSDGSTTEFSNDVEATR